MSEENIDGTLLARMRLDDENGLSGLYDRHAARVFSVARGILGDTGDAEDIVQEVFLQAWNQRHRYDETRAAVLTWLLVMTRSRALDRIRAARSRPMGHTAVADVAGSTVSNSDVLLNAWAHAALASLPASRRLAVELAYFSGYTHSEIARLLRQPLGTIKTRIRLGMLTLRDALAGFKTPKPSGEAPFTISVSELLTDPALARKLGSLEGVRVLVVDDDVDTLEMVATVLECAGASVMRGRSTREALARLSTQWPDVLLADLAMPDEDGYVLVRKARTLQGDTRQLGAGAFTGLSGASDRRAALTAGYDMYLTKPIQPQAMVRAVAELARRA